MTSAGEGETMKRMCVTIISTALLLTLPAAAEVIAGAEDDALAAMHVHRMLNALAAPFG